MRFRKIDVRIWNDRKFRSLSDHGKLVFILCLTHPNTNQLGLLRASSAALAMDLGWHLDAMRDAISEASRMGLLEIDDEAGLIVVPNFLRYNAPNGPNAMKALSGLLDLVPECDLLNKALTRINTVFAGMSDAMRNAIPDDIRDAIRNAMSDTTTDTTPDPGAGERAGEIEGAGKKERERKKNAAPLVAPFSLQSLPEDWRDLCKQVRPDLDPDRVFAAFRFYWTQGNGKGTRRKPESWARTWSNWIAKEREQQPHGATSSSEPVYRNAPLTQGQLDRLPTRDPDFLKKKFHLSDRPGWLKPDEPWPPIDDEDEIPQETAA